MGRFQTCIDRLTSARQPRRSEGGAWRRRLRFEQFESRLALSAAPPADGAADSDVVRLSGEMLHSLWDAAPGAAQWGDVTFAAPAGLDSNAYPWNLASAPGLRTFHLQPGALEGGLIAADFELRSFTEGALTFQGSSQFRSIGADQTFDLNAHILNPRDNVDPLGYAPLAVDSNPSAFDPAWPEGSAPLGFGDGVDSAGGAGEANVTLIESPVLRITAPLPSGDDQGGAIDVTAMVAPRALFAAQQATSLAAASGMPSSRGLAATAEAPRKGTTAEGSDGDELRARAVVYEVALARETGDESLDESHAERRPAATNKATTPAPAPQADDLGQTPPAHAREVVADEGAPQDAESGRATSEQTTGVDHDPAGKIAAARDAALARWGDKSDEPPAADIETASSRHQTVGLALAVVVSAGPIVKRMRRGKSTKFVEQTAGLD